MFRKCQTRLPLTFRIVWEHNSPWWYFCPEPSVLRHTLLFLPNPDCIPASNNQSPNQARPLLLPDCVSVYVSPQIHLSELEKGDEMALVRWLNDEVIYANTLRIPKPYKPEHARDFLRYTRIMRREHRHATEWAIRNLDGDMIGCIGFSRIYGKYSHKDELGYWLAAPYRGRGIMTEVVAVASDIGFRQFDLWRLEAPVFPHNSASAKVLEKNGFVAEGTLKNYVLKNSRPMDVTMYAKVRMR